MTAFRPSPKRGGVGGRVRRVQGRLQRRRGGYVHTGRREGPDLLDIGQEQPYRRPLCSSHVIVGHLGLAASCVDSNGVCVTNGKQEETTRQESRKSVTGPQQSRQLAD
ncbi:hypothetical protein OJ253_3678 [Cryptosporidium canis]|uniref:Uncharacterized protein n=1 Tax=Cryptosporidium canis TaxID=195482 RepID=A0A9D5DER7_9CRYT|nr:hypothetical protein OJ253_3678 [Cryptosporidium canis]